MKDSGPVKAEIEAARSEILVLQRQLERLKEENEALRAKASEEDRSWDLDLGYVVNLSYWMLLVQQYSTYGPNMDLWIFSPTETYG